MNGDELTENETYLTDKGALLVMGVVGECAYIWYMGTRKYGIHLSSVQFEKINSIFPNVHVLFCFFININMNNLNWNSIFTALKEDMNKHKML